jgi:hypothetical protein
MRFLHLAPPNIADVGTHPPHSFMDMSVLDTSMSSTVLNLALPQSSKSRLLRPAEVKSFRSVISLRPLHPMATCRSVQFGYGNLLGFQTALRAAGAGETMRKPSGQRRTIPRPCPRIRIDRRMIFGPGAPISPNFRKSCPAAVLVNQVKIKQIVSEIGSKCFLCADKLLEN